MRITGYEVLKGSLIMIGGFVAGLFIFLKLAGTLKVSWFWIILIVAVYLIIDFLIEFMLERSKLDGLFKVK